MIALAAKPAAPVATVSTAADCFILKAGPDSFGVPVEAVQTIFRIAAVTPVPLGPSIVVGLVNLRGKIVTAVSLARRLDADAAATVPRSGSLAVALEHAGEVFALLIDDVGDVMSCDETMRVAAPAHVAPERARLTRAYFRANGGIVPLLDIDALFDIKSDRRSGRDRRTNHSPRVTGETL
jgi:purine-binding chemotaxis protein CheW